MSEEFAPIDGYDWYLISESGRVWSEEHISPINGYNLKGRMLCTTTFSSRYRAQQLQKPDGEWTLRYIHDLVAAAFIGPKPDGMEVMHKDGDYLNNHWTNLEYGTHSKNQQDMWDNKTPEQRRRDAIGHKRYDMLDPSAARVSQ